MTPGEIARGLSKAKKRALMGEETSEAVGNQLENLGLVVMPRRVVSLVGGTASFYEKPGHITTLGLAVRAIIEQESKRE